MDAAEHNVLAYMAFPKAHGSQIKSTSPIERLNLEIKIFHNEDATIRLADALLLEQNDEWAVPPLDKPGIHGRTLR